MLRVLQREPCLHSFSSQMRSVLKSKMNSPIWKLPKSLLNLARSGDRCLKKRKRPMWKRVSPTEIAIKHNNPNSKGRILSLLQYHFSLLFIQTKPNPAVSVSLPDSTQWSMPISDNSANTMYTHMYEMPSQQNTFSNISIPMGFNSKIFIFIWLRYCSVVLFLHCYSVCLSILLFILFIGELLRNCYYYTSSSLYYYLRLLPLLSVSIYLTGWTKIVQSDAWTNSEDMIISQYFFCKLRIFL